VGTSGCLDENTVVAFLEGRLAAADRSCVESHLDSCNSCTELTAWAAADQAHRSGRTGQEGRPFIGPLAPGARVDRYQILAAVGRGGMGDVYAAYHPDLDRRIALKIVGESGAGAPERRARLLREARAIARLSHPNVITVHDAGTVDDRVYIAMEFVEGKTVDQWLRAAPRGWREIVDVFVAAGSGLAAAHAAGVVHRDFKPQNVMIGLDRSVRVMDFGLARLAEEPADPPELENTLDERPPIPVAVTRTGALVGTLAYMAPEQFRRERLDARADQFSFCVALHEALYGSRPPLAHLRDAPAADAGPGAETAASSSAGAPIAAFPRRAGAPAWLRAVVTRGLSEDRDRRFASMDALLAAIGRGRTRVRTRASVVAIGAALVLLSLGGWRLAAARRVSCGAPEDRLAAVWAPGDESNPRRQAVHRALVASGRPTAETVWRGVAATLDEYATRWSAMHVEACEATHVRGEQSGEVLDLRMSCLAETLDGLRALTEVLSRADGAVLSQAITAASNLTSLNRCADIPALRAAVPPPRDEQTTRTVASLQRRLREGVALEEVGSDRAALTVARELLPRAEATGYKPLIAEVLFLMGAAQANATPVEAEVALEKALYAAEASRDDVTAAKAAIDLVAVAGFAQGRRRDSERWASLAHAILDRLASPQPRLRAWLFHNEAATLLRLREFEPARALLEKALALKEATLGPNHPDVSRTAATLSWALTELHRPAEALPLADRAVDIMAKLDPDGVQLAIALNNRADALNMLGKHKAAEESYLGALRILRSQGGPASRGSAAFPLAGIGEARLAQGDAAAAIPYLDESLRLRDSNADPVPVADTQLALARALVAAGKDRGRARTLADSARATYASNALKTKEREAVAWLAANAAPR
jgi:eukaryotic-like serine/threonine-protein kinase